jgi:hypothetical protein
MTFYYCNFCNKTFQNIDDYYTHIYPVKVNKKNYNLQRYIKDNSNKKWKYHRKRVIVLSQSLFSDMNNNR